MYQGKYIQRTKYNKKRTNKRKATVLLTSLALLIVILVGTVTAFLIASDGPITNTFQASQVSCQVDEESFDGTTKTNVTISNTGDTEAYIRAAIVVTWKDKENGNVYGATPVLGNDYTMELNETDWFLGSDGYYYYKKPVTPTGTTTALITTCCVIQDAAPSGYGLNVEILGSAIQSVPTHTVSEAWPAVMVQEVEGKPIEHGELVKTGG